MTRNVDWLFQVAVYAILLRNGLSLFYRSRGPHGSTNITISVDAYIQRDQHSLNGKMAKSSIFRQI